MKRLADLVAQEHRALDAYEGVITAMVQSAEQQGEGVRPLDASFDAALAELADATNRVVAVHSTLRRALADHREGSNASGTDAHGPPPALDLDSLDRRRAALLEEGRRLRDLLGARRDRMHEEAQKVRVPARPRSVYGDGNRPSMIDVSG
jgi:hypothetical protein